jgi:hypothetical protein
MATAEPQESPTNVRNLIEVICALKEERYPFERHVALLTFGAWLRWPTEPDVVEQAEIASAARLILAIDFGEIRRVLKSRRQEVIAEIASKVFTPVAAAGALANASLGEPFWIGTQKSLPVLFDVAAIAAFFLKCPEKMSPSLNRALFFISKGGFSKDFTIGPNAKPYKVSKANLKNIWSSFAVTSPFSLAAERLSLREILSLAPEGIESVRLATKLLRNHKRVRRYFGHAKYIQDTLLKRLDKTSRERFKFVEFPEGVTPHVIKSLEFEPWQLKMIDDYHVKPNSKLSIEPPG